MAAGRRAVGGLFVYCAAVSLASSVLSGRNAWELALTLQGLRALISVALLLIAFFRLRAQGREFITLICGYLLTAAAITAAARFAAGSGASPIYNLLEILVWMVEGLLLLPALLWFARRASRMSLTHSFFLIFVGGAPYIELGGILTEFRFIATAYAYAYLALQAWMLRGFESRGARFRKGAVIALIALQAVEYTASSIVGSISLSLITSFTLMRVAAFTVLFALVYLVRVPRPADDEPAPAP